MYRDYFGTYFNPLKLLTPTNPTEEALQEKYKWLYNYFTMLSNVLIGTFEWQGMTYTQEKLINKASFFASYWGAWMYDGQVIVTPLQPIGQVNAWGEYNGYDAIMVDGTTKRVSLDDIVLGQSTFFQTVPDSVVVWNFSELLAELKLTIKNTIILSRKSAYIKTPDENSVNDALRKYNNLCVGNPIVIEDKRQNSTLGTMQFTDSKDVTDYYDNVRDVINEFLTVTGLSALVNPNKKERLITDEVSSNNDIKGALLSNKIKNRQEFCNAVNEKFGTDWSVAVSIDAEDNISEFANFLKGDDIDVNK